MLRRRLFAYDEERARIAKSLLEGSDGLSFASHVVHKHAGDHLLESANIVVAAYHNRNCRMTSREEYP